jgi:ribose 5-phosphate isomerase B
MNDFKIAIASDHAGYKLKDCIYKHLQERKCSVEDLGAYSNNSVDYPLFAYKVVEKVIFNKMTFGILLCGSGVGMSIAANRFPGIRAANCCDVYAAKMARLHNDANILCLGERIIGQGLAKEIVDVFLATNFEGGRHTRRLELIDEVAIKYWKEYIGRI